MSKAEDIESWLTGDEQRQADRERTVSSSTDRMTSEGPTQALSAMEHVALFLGLRPDVPMTLSGAISAEKITLTFDEPARLEAPFAPAYGDEGGTVWEIRCADTAQLPQGTAPGQQVEALTAIGHMRMDGVTSRMLVNMTGLRVLSIDAQPDFAREVMIGQVMEQATEPWSREHHIWLVGFGDLGPQLVEFLRPYHQHFHLVAELDEIDAQEVEDGQATIYVMNASDTTLGTFIPLNNGNVGMIADQVVNPQSLYICQVLDAPGMAELETGYADVEVQRIVPNRIEEDDPRYRAMLRMSQTDEAESGMDSITPEDFMQEPQGVEPESEPAPESDEDEAGIAAEVSESAEPSFTDDELDAFLRSMSTEASETESAPEPEPAAEPAPAPAAGVADETVEAAETERQNAPQPITPPFELRLMGAPGAVSAEGDVTGQAGEALAFLHLSGGEASPAEVSEALWPGDESEGNTARVRRSRLVKKINMGHNEHVSIDGSWKVKKMATDVQAVMEILADHDADDGAVIGACDLIANPLDGCNAWSADKREQMRADLTTVLDQRLNADADDSRAVREACEAARTRLQ